MGIPEDCIRISLRLFLRSDKIVARKFTTDISTNGTKVSDFVEC